MKYRKKKQIAMLLLIVTIVALFPVRRTEAAPASIGVVGNTHITYNSNGHQLYEITVKNGSLHVKGEYYSNSSALLSYHTEYLYFTTEPTGGYPKTADKCYPVRVHDHIRTNSTTPGYVHDTYVIDAGTLEKVAERLFGDRNALKGGRTVYISEGYVLKRRSSATNPKWKYDTEELDTIDAIRKAAGWSTTTKDNFQYYYDIELKLDLTRYNVSASATEGGFVSGDINFYIDKSLGTVVILFHVALATETM